MNRPTIMGASIVLLLAAFVLTPAEAYHKRHQQHAQSYRQAPDHFVLNQPERAARYHGTWLDQAGMSSSASTPPGGLPAIAPPKIAL